MSQRQELTFGAGLWLFGQFVDRYATDAYGPPVGTLEAIERAGAVGDIEVLDINYPFAERRTVEQVREALERNGLRCQAITPHLYMREFQKGALHQPRPGSARARRSTCARRPSRSRRRWTPKYVKFWPGQDGYDYPFQVDYRELWDYSVEGVRAVARGDPTCSSPSSTRSRSRGSTCSSARPRARCWRSRTMGVRGRRHRARPRATRCSPRRRRPTAVQLVRDRGRLFSVEVNDNWREWDDDMAVGSVHLIETLEFLLALRKIGWHEADPARPVPLPRGPGRGGAQQHQHDAALDARARPHRLDALPRLPGSARTRSAAQRLVIDAAARHGSLMTASRCRAPTAAELRRAGDARSGAATCRWSTRRGLGHIGGDLSAHDILATLYFGVLNVDPERPDDPERDRFILSKGHAAGALYTTLARRRLHPDGRARHLHEPRLAR